MIALNPSLTIARMQRHKRPVLAVKPGIYNPIYEGLAMAGVPE